MCYWITHEPFCIFLLGSDLMIRLYGPHYCSPFNAASRIVKKVMKIPTRISDAGPKRLAAHFGLLFSGLILSAHFAELPGMALGIAALLAVCAAMELLWNFCVGCRIYYLLQSLKMKWV
jgi:hypothetical protein